MRTGFRIVCGWLGSILLFGSACDSQSAGMSPRDGSVDQALPRDFATGPPDLSPPKLTLPTSCTAATLTAAQIYDPVFKSRCSNSNCHGGPLLPSLKSAADLPLMLGQASASDFPYVDAALDINRSYLLFKLTGEQRKVPHGGGDSMPPNAGLLDDPSLCMVINWIRSGAR